ncbi:MAG: efflux RND transporter periplasmic adaptor subunit [Tannerella sp.]|jgi:membrane fusion protein (multidrug efflux system)|nr:efflux RND transporter periplasmic adaptor subunit [Tannerella sp.]
MRTIYVTAVVAAVLSTTSCGRKPTAAAGASGAQPPVYPTAAVATGDAELAAVYPATLRGREDIEIRPRIDGFIEQIHIDEGSAVKQGQLLFKINSPQAEQAVTTAQAAVASAEAQLATARLNVDRMTPLAEKGIISPVQLETYRNACNVALAAHAQAVAQLDNARATLSWASVTSPVDGHVGAVPYRKGSLVNSQHVLTTVANTATVYAYFSLNEKALAGFLAGLAGETQAEKLKHAPEIALTLADGTVYPRRGRIETVTGTVSVATGSAGFRAEFPNPEGLLRSGASGKITIPTYYSGVILIPQKATFAQQDKVFVYAVEDGAARQRLVTVTPTPDGLTYIVHSGLTAGERIVTDGVATLADGTKISEN